MVSGSFHWVFHPSFHLSLTVLVHYRSVNVFSLGPWSARIPTGVCRLQRYLGYPRSGIGFQLRDYHPLWSQIPMCSPNRHPKLMRLLQPSDESEFRLFHFRSSLTWGISAI